MTDRDELAHEIRGLLHAEGAYCGNCDYESASCYECDNVLHRYADAILAAGYRKPRTITTVEELDELPDGSIIRTDNTFALEKVPDEFGTPWIWGHKLLSNRSVQLPALVLYIPEDPGATADNLALTDADIDDEDQP